MTLRDRKNCWITIIFSVFLLLVLILTSLYGFNRDFRLTTNIILRPESHCKFNGSDGSQLPLPSYSTFDFQTTPTYVVYCTFKNADEVVAFFKERADKGTFIKTANASYSFQYGKTQYNLVIQGNDSNKCLYGIEKK